MTIPVLADIAKFVNVATPVIDQALQVAPEFAVLPTKTVKGYTFNSLKRTANPAVTFRDVNVGVAGTKSTYANATITCKILNPRFTCDKAIADAHEWGPEAFIAAEAQAHVNAALLTAAKQLWYGTDNDSDGFAGLTVNAANVIDAGGTTADTASSAYIVCANDPDALSFVLGGDGQFEITQPRVGDVSDGTNDYTAYISEMICWMGAMLGDAYGVVRIRDLTADSGKGLTDALIYQALEVLPARLVPTHIFMNRRSQSQLRQSRTATNATGAPAPLPREVEGVEIVVTEALVSTEALSS